ncbi:hypothetical protein GCM10012275_31870 [Longimycelium tulufanense]|uniref:5'-Nucleotidase C-terminal domain-containing protein n=1 Tax=Longimycelium tulufanense TaxID=907463 RepID=A0A8J3CEW2_9PSEU|nr:hypothetical protein GCM10012275_31870 [Longimycelium tulufanense]
MTFKGSHVPAAPPFTIKKVHGVRVGIIGLPLQDLPSVVSAEGIKDLDFGPEIDAIDRYTDILDRMGVKVIVVTLHQGDNTEGGGPNDCRTTPGPARAIAEKVSPKVDVVFTGHSHQQYVCTVTDPAGQPRPMVQGFSFGRILSVVDIKVDRRTKDVIRSETKAFNHVVTRDVLADRSAQTLVDEAKSKAAPIANRPVGSITADIPRSSVASGESPLGNLIADAQLEATKDTGAQIALMNPGGVRGDLVFASSPAGEGDGVVTYGEAYTVQPFGNVLQTMTLTGTQLKAVLEQQWLTKPDGTVQQRVLQPSAGLHYTWSASAPVGSKVSDVTIGGQPLEPTGTYRVTVNSFLAGGGDGFTELRNGADVTGGVVDLDAFVDYLKAHPGLAPPATDRISLG